MSTMIRKAALKTFQIRKFTSSASTVDNNEIQLFTQFTNQWWDEFGPMKALHSMNKLRVPFIRDGLVNTGAVPLDKCNKPRPLHGLSILDIGCGGGILSEPLARLGGNITGIDANPLIISQAQSHAAEENLNINYITSSIEKHASENAERYDAIVASEIVEHVSKKEEFLEACAKCLKPNGSVFITTISKTFLANFLGVVVAENILNLLPKGTHEYEKFIEPHHLQRILLESKCKTDLIHGMCYNLLTNTWSWCSDTSINYGLHAVKYIEK